MSTAAQVIRPFAVSSRDRWAGFVALVFLAGAVADIATTAAFWGMDGIREGNPFVAWFIAGLGLLPALIVTKCATIVAVLVLARHFKAGATERMLLIVGGGFLAVAAHNFFLIVCN